MQESGQRLGICQLDAVISPECRWTDVTRVHEPLAAGPGPAMAAGPPPADALPPGQTPAPSDAGTMQCQGSGSEGSAKRSESPIELSGLGDSPRGMASVAGGPEQENDSIRRPRADAVGPGER